MGQISKAELVKFMAHAEACYPKEACGYVVKKGRRAVVIPVDNVSKDPTQEFLMDAQQQLAIEETENIIGLIHSHPDCQAARASEADIANCNTSELVWTIVTVPGGDVTEIHPETPPLIGRPFVLGTYDCWGLMVDWHALQGVDIPRYDDRPRHEWWTTGENPWYTEENILAAGFVMQEKPAVGSIIFMQVAAPTVNHVGLILPDGQMLHHLYGNLSGRTPYGGYWRERTWWTCRHKDLPPESEIKPC